MVGYRSMLEIRADILGVAKDGTEKIEIIYKANLSYKLLTNYLNDLLEGGMLHIEKKTGKYYTTYRGSKYRKRILKWMKWDKKVRQMKEELDKERDAILIEFGLKVNN
jgi:predicted transcriptional regulator